MSVQTPNISNAVVTATDGGTQVPRYLDPVSEPRMPTFPVEAALQRTPPTTPALG